MKCCGHVGAEWLVRSREVNQSAAAVGFIHLANFVPFARPPRLDQNLFHPLARPHLSCRTPLQAGQRGRQSSVLPDEGAGGPGATAEVYVVPASCYRAGGTLDEDLVEQWGFYEKSVKGRYHFVALELEFETMRAKERKDVRLYRVGEQWRCKAGEMAVVDALGWKAVGVEGKVFDEFRIEAEGCR